VDEGEEEEEEEGEEEEGGSGGSAPRQQAEESEDDEGAALMEDALEALGQAQELVSRAGALVGEYGLLFDDSEQEQERLRERLQVGGARRRSGCAGPGGWAGAGHSSGVCATAARLHSSPACAPLLLCAACPPTPLPPSRRRRRRRRRHPAGA
jgi:hypothetical protein